MPKSKDETKVKAIFEASLRLILESGFVDFTMAAVAKEADLATGTIYIYFKDKKSLINGLYQKLKASKMEETFRGYDPGMPFPHGFRLLWFNYLNASLRHPERTLFIDQYQKSKVLNEKSQAIRQAAYQPLYRYLKKAQEDHYVKEIPVEVMAASLMGGANQVARLYFGKADSIDSALLENCFTMAWHSIRK